MIFVDVFPVPFFTAIFFAYVLNRIEIERGVVVDVHAARDGVDANDVDVDALLVASVLGDDHIVVALGALGANARADALAHDVDVVVVDVVVARWRTRARARRMARTRGSV